MSRHDPTEVTRRHVFAQQGLSKKEEQARIVVLAGKLAGDKYPIERELTLGRGEQIGAPPAFARGRRTPGSLPPCVP